MLIRRMKEEDIPYVAEIEKRSITPPWSEQAFRDAMKEETLMMVITDGDEESAGAGGIMGYIVMYISFEEGEITNVAIDPQQRGKGLSWLLMQEFTSEASKLGVERIVLEVRVSNAPAIGLYHKAGFVDLGKRKNFYEQPKEDALIMELNIC